MCIPVIDTDCNPLGDLAAGTAKRFLDELAQQTAEAAAEMLRHLVTGWLSIPSPTVSDDSGPVAYLRAYTNWAVAAIAVGAVLVAAIRLAWERNGREAGSFARGLVMLVVLAGAGVPVVRLLIEIGDSYSTWILDQSADGDLGKRLLLFSPAVAGAAVNALPALAMMGISVLIFLVTLVQLLMLIARGAGLVLLSGLLPLAAAGGIAGGGRGIRDRYLAWLLAMVLYKPAAATIYATAFWMLGHGQDLTTLLSGVVMFCMAIVALPALMRLIAPAVATLSSGGGSGAGVAAASGAAQVASGAIRLSAGGGGRRGGGQAASGTAAPSGATPGGPMPTPAAAGGASGVATGGAGASAAAGGGAGAGMAGAGAAGAGAGAAAAGPVGLAVAAGVEAAKAGPAVVRKVGGTASGAIGGEG